MRLKTHATLGPVRGRGPLPKAVGGVERSETVFNLIVAEWKIYLH